RFYSVARSLQPALGHELAHALENRGDTDEALAVFRDLTKLRPGNARHLACLARSLSIKGLSREADETLEAAVAAAREAVQVRPDDSVRHLILGTTVLRQGKLEEAVAEARAALRLKPEEAQGELLLGEALELQGKRDEAIKSYRAAIRLKP